MKAYLTEPVGDSSITCPRSNFDATIAKYSTKNESHDRKRGMLLGVAYGDALGSPCELKSNEMQPSLCTGEFHTSWIHKRKNQYGFCVEYALGQVTDDTEMTIACLKTLSIGYTKERAIKQYHDFVNSGTYSLGTNTKSLFHGYKNSKMFKKRYDSKFSTNEAIEQSQSNGFLMRASPISFIDNASLRHNIAMIDSMITNPSLIARRVGLFYVDLLHDCHTWEKTGKELGMHVREKVEQASLNDIENCFRDALTQEYNRNLEENKGWCVASLSVALWAALHFQTLHDGVVAVIRLGGDTDTNACIAGSILGAMYGEDLCLSHDQTFANFKVISDCTAMITSGKYGEMKQTARPVQYHPSRLFHLLKTVENFDNLQDAVHVSEDLICLQKTIEKHRKRKASGKLIGLTGASTSGKTTLARKLDTLLRQKGYLTKVISQDDHKCSPYAASCNGKITWEDPSRTDWQKLSNSIFEQQQLFDFVIVEGFSLFYLPTEVLEHFTHSFVLDHTIEECIKRRTAFPSVTKYGLRGWDNVQSYIEECVWPCHVDYLKNRIIKENVTMLRSDGTVESRTSIIVKHLMNIL